jgi:CheY-like chemotaxis protein
MKNDPVVILLADDDPDDRELTQRALKKSRVANSVHCVEDGEELLEYLRREGRYSDQDLPRPGLVLLDLNMPRMDGREALEQIKRDAELRSIPVVVLTTSDAEQDIVRSYDLGVNAFVTKPVTFDGLADVIRIMSDFWFEIVRLPVNAS